MEVLFFRPNAQLSSLFLDTPMECISIDNESISETITDYHGNFLAVNSQSGETLGVCSPSLIKTLIMSFDMQGSYIDSIPNSTVYSDVCRWVYKVLLERGWLLMGSRYSEKRGKTVNGKELLFWIKEDEVKNEAE